MFSYRSDFPIFSSNPNLVYLDSAATSQKPTQVIEAVHYFYTHHNATIHRGLYPLSIQSTTSYEKAREAVAQFIGAPSAKEIVFTRNATESLNLLSHSLGELFNEGENIILSELEHHANLVPWQQLARQKGLELKFIKVKENGQLDIEQFKSLLDSQTRLVSLSHCSNVLGTFTPLVEIKKIMKQEGSAAWLCVDASQSVAHVSLNVQELGCDFLVFSSHKVYGPSGVGILWGKEEWLSQLPPYQTGGDMIKTVSWETATWNDLPWKFEAGTPNIEGAIGLAAALDYLTGISMTEVGSHTQQLSTLAQSQLQTIPEVTIVGSPDPASGIISFTVQGIHPHDLASHLGEQEICIRAGQHCASPLHANLQLVATNRLSVGIYNQPSDIDRFIQALKEFISQFQHV